MIVRRATQDDAPAIIAMGAKFFADTSYAAFADYSDASASVLVAMMLDGGVLLVAENDGVLIGMAGLVVTPFLFNHALKAAHEVMWWVDPAARRTGAGAALLHAIEPACRAAGAAVIQMIHLADSPPQAAALYERAGYVHSESSYTKVL